MIENYYFDEKRTPTPTPAITLALNRQRDWMEAMEQKGTSIPTPKDKKGGGD